MSADPFLSALQEEATKFIVRTIEHFYYVGSTEDLRNSIIEALIGNYELPELLIGEKFLEQQALEI